ncbi:hypothetical protein LPJ53_004432 [Coemansia erecta]|uniref:Kinase n=1 Tax=Coemansia erecta TaxID=147472 RepID=A0A9W8CPT7_9FUNG|nr:hypothetical protein LPJ53_004432 [Coemansia erecta]
MQQKDTSSALSIGELLTEDAGVREFQHQIHGHGGILGAGNGKVLLKQLIEREHKFYEESANYPLVKPFLANYHGTVKLKSEVIEHAARNATFPVDLSGIETRSADTYICLESLVHGFENPCIADIKMGKQMYDLDATPEKRATMEAKMKGRTIVHIGFSISGICRPDEPRFDRQELHKLTLKTIITEGLVPFFETAESAVSADYRRFIIEQFIAEIVSYRDVIRKSETRMFSSSLLLVYDVSKDKYQKYLAGDKSVCAVGRPQSSVDDKGASPLLNMRAIDFGHGHWLPGEGPDEQYLFGLDNFIRILREILNGEY